VLAAKKPKLVYLNKKNKNKNKSKTKPLMSYFQLQHNNQDMLGYGAAMGGTLLTACNFVCMRKLRTVHFSVLIFAFSVMSAAVSAAIVPVVAEFTLPKTMEEWAYSLLVGIFGLIGQSLLALALRYMFVCLFVSI
jgi:drug/metabolite transporter (DMT)-like permease